MTDWRYDDGSIDAHLAQRLGDLPFAAILAHPGKTFYDIHRNVEFPTIKQFKEFVKNTVKTYNLSGSECLYRAYHDTKLDYNSLVCEALGELQGEYKNTLYGIAGSDKHHGFEIQ